MLTIDQNLPTMTGKDHLMSGGNCKKSLYRLKLPVETLDTNLNNAEVGIGEDIKKKKFNSEFEKVLVNLIFTSNWLNE